MVANIREDEFLLLAYMHEYATGYTSEFSLDPETVIKALAVSREQFLKNLSYLVAHDLAGMNTLDASTFGDPNAFLLQGFWLTGRGENYLRELENQPGLPQKITVKVIKGGWGLVRDAAVRLLSDLIKGSL